MLLRGTHIWEFISLTVTFLGHTHYGRLAGDPRGLSATPTFTWNGDRGPWAGGESQGLGGECPPLQFLMIFIPKGLQGERGLRGLTGEKGEPVRGGWQGMQIAEEPWGGRGWAPGVAAVRKMEVNSF